MNDVRLKGTPKQGLLGATLGFFIGFTAVSLLGLSAKIFQDFMNLTPVMVGLLVSAPNLSGSILRIPFSAMVDSTGGRKPFLILLVLSAIGILGLYLIVEFYYPHRMATEFYWLLLLFGVLGGCGVATFSVGIGQTSYWFPQRLQGSALGIYAGIGNMAPGIFTFLFPMVLFQFGLSGSYFVWLVFLVVGIIIYYLIGKNAWYFQMLKQGVSRDNAKIFSSKQYGQDIFPEGGFKQSLLVSAKSWKTWVLVLTYFTTFGGFLALAVWLPTYWPMFHSVPIGTASWLTTLFIISASVIRIAGGRITDKIGGEKTAKLSLLTMFAGTVIMIFSYDIILSVFGIGVMAIGMGITNAAVFKLVPQEIPQAVGGAAGWVGGLGAFGGFVIPIMMATFVKTQNVGDPGYVHGFTIFASLALMSIVLIYLLEQIRRPQ
jgi:NNP family nitrate/nitrite transporter-like MFS transporter